MRSRLKRFCSIRWYQTLVMNFKTFGWKDALKLPIVIFRGFSVQQYKGEIKIEAPLTFGMIGFGQPYEIFTRTKNAGEAIINGKLICKGSVQFGVDTKIYVLENATLVLGHINSFATNTQIICFQYIEMGNWVQCGADCLFVDTNFHDLKHIETQEILPREGKIHIGNHVYIGTKTIVRSQSYIPNETLIGSYTLCNRDYRAGGEGQTLAGIPAKVVKTGVVRDWESEKKDLENYLKIRWS